MFVIWIHLSTQVPPSPTVHCAPQKAIGLRFRRRANLVPNEHLPFPTRSELLPIRYYYDLPLPFKLLLHPAPQTKQRERCQLSKTLQNAHPGPYLLFTWICWRTLEKIKIIPKRSFKSRSWKLTFLAKPVQILEEQTEKRRCLKNRLSQGVSWFSQSRSVGKGASTTRMPLPNIQG